MKLFITLFKIAVELMKNGIYFVVIIALLVPELFKILIYKCKLEDLWHDNVDTVM